MTDEKREAVGFSITEIANMRKAHRRKLNLATRDKAGRSPLPKYVPEINEVTGKPTGRLRATRPAPQFQKSRKEIPLIPGYEPGATGDSGAEGPE